MSEWEQEDMCVRCEIWMKGGGDPEVAWTKRKILTFLRMVTLWLLSTFFYLHLARAATLSSAKIMKRRVWLPRRSIVLSVIPSSIFNKKPLPPALTNKALRWVNECEETKRKIEAFFVFHWSLPLSSINPVLHLATIAYLLFLVCFSHLALFFCSPWYQPSVGKQVDWCIWGSGQRKEREKRDLRQRWSIHGHRKNERNPVRHSWDVTQTCWCSTLFISLEN